MALIWVWLLCCFPGAFGVRGSSIPVPSFSSPALQKDIAIFPDLDLTSSRDQVVSRLGLEADIGPRRTLLSVNPNCTAACNDTATLCIANCSNTNCRNVCGSNQTSCLVDCHRCGNLTSLVNGAISYSNGDKINSIATHTCNGGYNLQGGSRRTCDIANDTWIDSAVRSCLGVACSALGTPTYGSNDLTPTPTPRYPKKASFLCGTGRKLAAGNITRVFCGWDGFWYKTDGTNVTQPPTNLFNSGTDMPICEDINECNLNSTICTQQCNNTIGGYTCTCFPGYYLSGPNECTGQNCEHLASLANGIWNYTVNGSVVQSNNYDCKYPCVATLACNTGFVPANVTFQTCTSSLSWDTPSSNTVCIGRTCNRTFPSPSPTMDTNLVTSWAAYPPSGRFQDRITVTCKAGYTLQQGSSATWQCGGDGDWDCGPTPCVMPVCVGKPCGNPPTYNKGTAVPTNDRIYPANVTYPCDEGYTQTGANGTYRCVLPGLTWEGPWPSCSGRVCGKPPNSTNTSAIAWTSISFPANATYDCNPNYFTVRTLTTYCQNNGNWPSAPTCYLRQITSVAATVLPDTLGTTRITLSGTFGEDNNYVISSITYGPPSNEGLYSCNSRSNVNANTIYCTPQAGVGGPYTLVVSGTSSSTSGPYVIRFVSAFRYPAPTMQNSIGVKFNDGSSATVTDLIVLKSTLGGDILTITGTNFGTDPTKVFVTMADQAAQSRIPFICAINTVTNTRITCTVPYGDSGPYSFRVGTGVDEQEDNGAPNGTTILWSAYSSVLIRYPAGPVINKVDGCPTVIGQGTSGCTTIGGTILLIQGSGFLGGANDTTDKPIVTVAGDFCTYINHTSSSIYCIMPSGTGLNQLVVVATGQGLAQRTLVNYVAATVTLVEGCLKDCSREGGDSITLTGANFGSCCSSVIVGDIACNAVRHDDLTPHSKLTCLLAPDKGLDKSIIMQQNRGQVTYVQSYAVSFTQCQPGTMDEAAPSRVCRACVPGKYTDVVAMTSCIDCEVGRYQARSGQSSCTEAESSRYVDVRGSNRSLLCPEGTFSTDVGRASCPPCEAGTYARLTGNSICQACARGSAQASPGKNSCTQCPAGKFADSPGQYVCSDCPPGFVQPLIGKTSCTPCFRGKISLDTITCVNCSIGQYSDRDGLAACERCKPGYYQDSSGRSNCVDCVPGKFQADYQSTKCDPCQIGKFQSLYQQDSCNPCVAGFATDVVGSVSCVACLAGQFSPTDGQALCTQCEFGKYSSQPGQVTCVNCNKGSIGPTRSLTVCQACNAGTIAANDGLTTCQQCTAGYYSPTFGQSSCTACDLGFSTGSGGASFCTACQPGYFAPSSASTSCSPCSPGKYSENLQSFACKQCDTGRASNTVALPTNCPVCPAGTYTDIMAAISCVNCPLGSFWGTAQSSSCQKCTPGTFADTLATTRCRECAVGRFGNVEGLSVCLECSQGYFSAYNGTSICTACDPGTFAADNEMSFCVQCVPGKFVELAAQSSCSNCPFGKYSAIDPKSCLNCDPGTYANVTGLPQCAQCDKGTFAQGAGLSSCPLCPAGRNAPSEGSKICPLCEEGKYANNTGQSTCDDCAPGRAAQDKGLNLCRDCDPGSSAQQPGSRTCALCALGFSQKNPRAVSCDECAPGTFTDKTGMAQCEECAAGRATQDLLQKDHCELCAPGKYANFTGQSNCDDCAKGRFISTSGNAECADCLPGTFASNDGTPLCALCAPGRHSNESAAVSCEDCEDGTESTGFASAICEPCQPGKFATAGSSRCADCASGKVNDMYGRSSCTNCDPGTYCPEEGGTKCAECLPGRMANSFGQSHCTLCAPGKFSNESRAIQCDDCAGGKYQEATMTTVCFDCGIGKSSSAGQAKCDDCPSQTAQPYRAQPTCLRCDALSKQSELKDECVCNPGTYAPPRTGPSQANLPCEPCPRGGDCSVKGTTFENIGSGYGFWRQDASQLVFYQCQMPDYCPGGNVSTCAGHRTGALCGFCLPGYAASGAGGLGECSECVSEGASAATVVGISITAIIVIFILYYIVLYSDRKLLTKLKERQKAQITELKQDYEQIDSSAFENFEEGIEKLTNRANQERMRPNPVYKLKIVLGFFQIMSNLAFGISFGWPTLYRKFLMIFNIINMDFFPWGSMSCLATLTYKSKLIIITMTPVGLFVLLICLYVLPKLYRDRRDMSDDDDLRNRRERSRIKFMKLCLFTVFAMFPFISSSVVKLWVCREIDGVYYLLADMGIRCYEEAWNDMLPMGVIFVLIYPVGIPLTFLGMLLFFRKRFKDPDVRIRLGFIYAAYTEDNWWFELYDIASKLYLTSLVVFFSESLQYGAVLIWLGIYIIVVLIRKPYITKGDDRLQLFSILEIYLLVSCAMVLKVINEKMDDVLDNFLSVCLIFLTLLIAVGGIVMIARNLRKMYFEHKRKQLIEKGMLSGADEELAIADETAEEQVLSWATKVRLRAVQLPKKLVAPPKPPPRVKPARPPRKSAVEEVAAVTHAHRAPARYGGRVLAAVQNIEIKQAESNSWQTMYTSKSTRRITGDVAETTTGNLAVTVDPFAPAPGESRESATAGSPAKKPARPSSAVSPKPARSTSPSGAGDRPPPLPRVESELEIKFKARQSPKPAVTEEPAKVAQKSPRLPVKKLEPEIETGSENDVPSKAVDPVPIASKKPSKPQKRDSESSPATQLESAPTGSESPPRASSGAEGKTDDEAPAQKPKPPPKSRASESNSQAPSLPKSPSFLSPADTESNALEGSAQPARPAKPAKLTRQQRES